MNALVIARHHVMRIVRSPGLVLLLIAIPVTLAALEYAAFGPTVAAGKLPPIKILVLRPRSACSSVRCSATRTSAGPPRSGRRSCSRRLAGYGGRSKSWDRR